MPRKLKGGPRETGGGGWEFRVKSRQCELGAKKFERALLPGCPKGLVGGVARAPTRLEELRGADATALTGGTGAKP